MYTLGAPMVAVGYGSILPVSRQAQREANCCVNGELGALGTQISPDLSGPQAPLLQSKSTGVEGRWQDPWGASVKGCKGPFLAPAFHTVALELLPAEQGSLR